MILRIIKRYTFTLNKWLFHIRVKRTSKTSNHSNDHFMFLELPHLNEKDPCCFYFDWNLLRIIWMHGRDFYSFFFGIIINYIENWIELKEKGKCEFIVFHILKVMFFFKNVKRSFSKRRKKMSGVLKELLVLLEERLVEHDESRKMCKPSY